MTDRELMQQVLEALEYASDMTKPENMSGCGCPICVTITALNERLAQPEQEPVTGNILKDAYNAMVEKKTRSQKLREAGFTRRPKGWEKEKEKDEQEPVAYLCENAVGHKYFRWKKPSSTYKPIALYTTPPLRPWVGLTDEELEAMAEKFVTNCYFDTLKYARAIETKLKEKNK